MFFHTHRTPYDYSTIPGYILHTFVQMGIATVYFTFYSCQLSIFLGFIFYLKAFADDFIHIFDEVDLLLEKSSKNSSETGMKTNEMFIDAIKLKQIMIQ